MSRLTIFGGVPLMGEVKISGSKNAALPLLAASLLTEEKVVLNNVPNLVDIKHLLDVLKNAGVQLEVIGNTVILESGKNINTNFCDEILSEMRASILLLGAAASRFKEVKVRIPGGCKIGSRPHDQHIKGFNALNIKTIESDFGISCETSPAIGGRVDFDVVTVTGTENILMAAVLAEGDTIITNAAREPEVVDLANMLNQMGAKIDGAGTDTIRVTGVSKLNGVNYNIIPDRIELGTFLCAAAGTGGDVICTNASPNHVILILNMLRDMGCGVEVSDDNQSIRLKAFGRLKPINIETQPYPGFPTDLQPLFMVLNTIANGHSSITENIYENRLSHAEDLNAMGGNLTIDNRKVFINGVEKLSGATVFPRDLRASAAMVVAGLIAEGETVIRNLQYLDRGYDMLDKKMRTIGAKITRE